MPVTDSRAGAVTSLSQLMYHFETNWGVAPATKYTLIGLNSETLGLNKTTIESNRITGFGQVADHILTGLVVNGAVPCEFSLDAPAAGGFMDLIQSPHFDSWVAAPAPVSTAITGTAPATFGGTGIDTGLSPGDAVVIEGFSGPEITNNDVWSVLTVATDTITVFGRNTVITGSGGTDIIKPATLSQGTDVHSMTMEKKFGGIATPQHIAMPGCVIGGYDLGLDTASVVSFGLTNIIGKSQNDVSTSPVGDGSPNAVPGGQVLNTVADVGVMRLEGTGFTSFLQSWNMSFTKNLGEQTAIHGSADLVGILDGDFAGTGAMTAYFDDGSLVNIFKNHTTVETFFPVADSVNLNMAVWNVPSTYLSGQGTPQIAGKNQSVFQNYDLQMRRDPTRGYTAKVSYLTGLAAIP